MTIVDVVTIVLMLVIAATAIVASAVIVCSACRMNRELLRVQRERMERMTDDKRD